MVSEIVSSFDRTVAFVLDLVADVPDDQMTTQPPGVPNHAAWTLGHMAVSCEGVAGEFGVEPWLPDTWQKLFGYGSTPSGAVSGFPGKAALVEALGDSSKRLRTVIVEASPEQLATPLPDEKLRQILPTLGHAAVQVVVAHAAYHAGQLAVWYWSLAAYPRCWVDTRERGQPWTAEPSGCGAMLAGGWSWSRDGESAMAGPGRAVALSSSCERRVLECGTPHAARPKAGPRPHERYVPGGSADSGTLAG